MRRSRTSPRAPGFRRPRRSGGYNGCGSKRSSSGDVSIIDPKKVGLGVTLLVEIELERDRPELMANLHQWIAKTPEVQEAWCITGRGDYTLVVVCRSIDDFDTLAERLVNENPNVRKFTTHVVLKTLKRGLAIPLT